MARTSNKKTILLPDGRTVEINNDDFKEFAAIPYGVMWAIWRYEPRPEVQYEIVMAALHFGYTGRKVEVSPEAEVFYNQLCNSLKTSRTNSKNAKPKKDKPAKKDGEPIPEDMLQADNPEITDGITGEIPAESATESNAVVEQYPTPKPSDNKPNNEAITPQYQAAYQTDIDDYSDIPF